MCNSTRVYVTTGMFSLFKLKELTLINEYQICLISIKQVLLLFNLDFFFRPYVLLNTYFNFRCSLNIRLYYDIRWTLLPNCYVSLVFYSNTNLTKFYLS